MVNILEFAAKVQEYEDPEKLDVALETLPLTDLYAEAEEMVNAGSEWSMEDCLVISMLKWFKTWFQWVNAPPCTKCGCTEMRGPQTSKPLPEELKYGARVVEVWTCTQCSMNSSFPRYNDPVKLLETRRGRCGEWCNVMQLILRALGRTVRYIWNSEDHVWNEIWSEKAGRWIHVDCCEAAFDKPLTYTNGWGKKMAYVLAFSTGGAADVTARYVRSSDMQLPRTLIGENELEVSLASLTANIRANFDPVDLVEWYERDEAEKIELASYQQANTNHNDNSEYQSRQSGSREWTEARGEAGK